MWLPGTSAFHTLSTGRGAARPLNKDELIVDRAICMNTPTGVPAKHDIHIHPLISLRPFWLGEGQAWGCKIKRPGLRGKGWLLVRIMEWTSGSILRSSALIDLWSGTMGWIGDACVAMGTQRDGAYLSCCNKRRHVYDHFGERFIDMGWSIYQEAINGKTTKKRNKMGTKPLHRISTKVSRLRRNL